MMKIIGPCFRACSSSTTMNSILQPLFRPLFDTIHALVSLIFSNMLFITKNCLCLFAYWFTYFLISRLLACLLVCFFATLVVYLFVCYLVCCRRCPMLAHGTTKKPLYG